MSSTKYYALLLLAGNALADSGDFVVGFGLESDSDDGISTVLLGARVLARTPGCRAVSPKALWSWQRATTSNQIS